MMNPFFRIKSMIYAIALHYDTRNCYSPISKSNLFLFHITSKNQTRTDQLARVWLNAIVAIYQNQTHGTFLE